MPKTLLRRRALISSVLACLPWAGGSAFAQAAATPTRRPWPSQPLKIIVGFPAGSSPDLTARTLAEPLSAMLGQPVVVENKVGAGGNIAANFVAKARDQHTIGLMINGNMTIAKLLNPRLAYDPLTDLAPISLIGVSPLVLSVPLDGPGADAQDFFQAARAAGGRWSYGSPGVGTLGHLGMELLKSKTSIQPLHVPYPGYPQVAQAMLGGHLQLSLLPPALALAQIKAGKLRAIGLTSSGRSPLAPELPSLAELGVSDFALEIWNGVAAPKSMPAPIVARLATALGTIARSPDIRAKLFQQGWQVVGSAPQGLAERIQRDRRELGAVIERHGITAE